MQLLLIIDEIAGHTSAGSGTGKRLHLIRSGQVLMVGRDPLRADIVIKGDDSVSAMHFLISCQPDGCRLTDSGSRHGTSLNGKPATEAKLSDGDHIIAGETRFVVRLIEMPTPSDESSDTIRVSARAIRSSADSEAGSGGGEPGQTTDVPVRPVRFTLQIIQQLPGNDGRSYASRLFTSVMPGETVVIGRVPERANLPFPFDHEMSGAHFELICGPRECRLRDLRSTNGTFLNGELMNNLLLRDGDEIRAGRTYFIVHLEDLLQSEKDPIPRPQQTVANLGLMQGLRKETTRASGNFRVVNTTPFALAPLRGQIDFPNHSVTLIVKGTFRLRNNQVAVAADEQPFPAGDVPFDGDEDPVRPPRYESDFAFFKPCADILLVGHCHAPGGQAVRKLKVGLRVGQFSRTLDVFGKRLWQMDRGEWRTTQAEPFSSLDLNCRYSFGGPGCDANPFGIGFRPKKLRNADSPLPVPRIEWPDAPMKSPDDRVEPAGFYPVGRWYGRRRRQLGTYDKAWEKTRWPWFPSDFSWQHCNAAAEAMQVDGFLTGDEQLILTNLHPQHPEYRSQLPGIRIRCFVNPLGKEFREVPTQLDTLWLDTDAETCVLVWRGHTKVASEDCEDLRHVFVVSERLDEPPLSVGEYHARLLDELAGRDARFSPPPESPPSAQPSNTSEVEDTMTSSKGAAADTSAMPDISEASAAETAAQEQNRRFEAELQQLKAQVRDAQLASGTDPDAFDRQVEAETARLIREWGLDGDVPPPDLEQRVNAELLRVKKQVYDAQVAAGLNPDPLPDEFPATAAGDAPPSENADSASRWTRERVIAHHAAGESFAGEDLSELDLSGLDLSGADFRTTILTKVLLSSSSLRGAQLQLATLAGADLSEADMEQAVLDHADLSGANLHGARLTEIHAHATIFSGAWLTGAFCQKADAAGAQFAGADLTNADLSHSCFNGADFSDARLGSADFRHSSLVEAVLESASAKNARFDHANLSKLRAAGADFSNSRFQQVQAPDAIFERACLNAADLSWSGLQGVNFTNASLEDAQLHAADLSGCRLSKANLKNARITDAKLFEASLRQTDLTGADISRSNLYGSELMGAIWKDTRRDSVNWKMTRMVDSEQQS